ncbi:MAG TPA: riboflavin synthase [Acidiferrobacterales bacterium]|nr:riboflavin synthase [Acidiferrobacterales bacterium]
MFTGIIQAVGKIEVIEMQGGDARLRIDATPLDMDDVRLGDSIAVNGVCLTAIEHSAHGFGVDVSAETLRLTTLGALGAGTRVNLEKALTPSSRLGGHLVSGHVDGVGEVIERRSEARCVRFRIQAPAALARYIAMKGSICVDGVSLTVNAVDGAQFDLNIVPHTLQATTLGETWTGNRVNLEVDVIARYLERLLLGERAAEAHAPISHAFLAEHGFLDK